MRVAFDDQAFTMQVRGGVSRCFVELMRHLQTEPDVQVSCSARWGKSEHAISAGLVQPAPGALHGSRTAMQWLNSAFASHPEGDINHATFYHPSYLARWSRLRNRVVTVHDMIPEKFPDLLEGNPHLAKESFLSAADLILCISQSAKDDVCEIYKIDPGRIEVIHHGVDAIAFQGRDPSSNIHTRPPYVLFIGKRSSYKDFEVLVHGFSRAKSTHPPMSLVCVGGGPFTESELRAFRQHGIDGRVVQVSVDDMELATLYAGAAVFVFPSRYEGFGLPTLEAMAAGCPVVLANSSSHPEVAGDAALYFRPLDSEDLATQLDRVLDDEACRSELVKKGLARCHGFTWARTAASTLSAYRRLAERT